MHSKNSATLRALLFSVIIFCGSTLRAESVVFDGVDDHVAIGADSALATSKFTVETWFKRAAGGVTELVNTTQSYPLISRGNAANFFLGIASDGRLHGQVKSPSGFRYSLFSASAVPVGEWHHGALTYDGSILRLYLDGVQVSFSSPATTLDTTTAGTRLGQIVYLSVPYGAFAGKMDEVRIWNSARTQAQIQTHMGVPLEFAPGLLARWGFDGGVTTSSGLNEIASTLANGAAYVADVPPLANTQPRATLTAPTGPINADNASPIAFTATASDADDTIVRVEFHDQLRKLGEVATAPYTFLWNPTIGNHTVRAVAVDAAGHVNGATAITQVNITAVAGSEAIYLDGSQSVSSIASASLSTYTVETWFRIEGDGTPVAYGTANGAAGDVCAFVYRGSSASVGSYLLGFRPTDDRLIGGYINGPQSCAVGNTQIVRGMWNHAAVTFDGAAVRIYLNGALDGVVRSNAAFPTPVANTFIGGITATTGRFNGHLDEVRVWNYARPMAAIQGARLLRNIPNTALPIYFQMNEGSGTTITNSGSAGGTLVFPAAIGWTLSAPSQAGAAPLVTLTAPSAGTVAEGAIVAFSASATDDGSVARVEFWENATKLGESLSAPYEMSWTAGPAGNRRITAVAIDNDGFAGTVAPATVTVSPAAGTTGLWFDGVDDRATGVGASVATQRYTVEAWFRRDDFGRAYPFDGTTLIEPIVVNQTTGTSTNSLNFLLGIRQRDGVLIGLNTPGATVATIGATAIPFGEWHHAALSNDGSKLSLYLDGTLISQTNSGVSLIGSMTISVGAHQSGLANFLGAVDDVRVWSVARTAGEIATARSLDVADSPGLAARWAFNEGSATTLNSTPGTSIPLTLVGGGVWTQGVSLLTNQLPIVSITAPASASSVPILTLNTVSCTASDPDGSIALVELYADGTKVAELSSAPYDFTYTTLSLGAHTLRAVAYDNSGAAAGTTLVSYTGVPPSGADGLFFDGVDDYVASPAVAALGLPRYTVETWFRREGNGVSTAIGTTSVYPMISRGSSADGFNFVLGIHATTGVLSGGFNALGSLTTSASGTTAIPSGEWHHAAMSFDGATLRLFLDGQQIASAVATLTPRTDALFRIGIGATVSNAGTRAGAFRGFLDEVRIWDHARPASAIEADRWSTAFAGSGAMARWALSEGTGATTTSSGSLAGVTGTLNGGAQWTIGRPAPAASVPSVTLSAASAGTVGVPFLLSAAPTSGDAISKVEFFMGAVKLGETTSAPWQWTYSATGDSSVVFSSVVTTSTGQKAASNDVAVVFTQSGGGGVYFDGVDDFVQLPSSAELSNSTFTWEFWFKPSGTGIAANNTMPIVPLISRGAGGVSGERVDYVVGISNTRRLVAFFTGTTTGTATLADNTWYHCAVVRNGTSLKMYINGALDISTTLTALTPLAVAPPAIGTSLDSLGVSRGAFYGTMDEVRLWSTERSAAEIAANMGREIHGAPGLIARWGFAEPTGATVSDSGPSALTGSMRNGAAHTVGASLSIDAPPSVTLATPANNAASETAPTQLTATLGGDVGESLTSAFYGREIPRGLSDFTVVVLPDIGNYTASQNGGTPATLDAMMDWIVAQRSAQNIVFVTQTGILIAGVDATAETQVASTAFAKLENPANTGSSWGIPFGTAFGDTDNLAAYDTAFGPARVAGKPWFAGSQAAASNANHAEFFNAGGAGYGVIHLAHNASLLTSSASVVWAKALLAKNRDRQFIVVFHDLISPPSGATFTTAGQNLYTALSSETNVVMILGGNAPGEYRRTESSGGRFYHACSANFSGRPNGGNGWLRLLEFSPSTGRIGVRTYSPTLAQFEVDADSEFTLRWAAPMLAPWSLIGSNTPQSPGATSTPWATTGGRRYEWYASVADATNMVTSATRRFSTAPPLGAQLPAVALTSPEQPISVALPGVVVLGATATSPDDTIESVEFFADGFLISSDTTAPYSVIWQPGAAGTFQITATATDRRGLQTTTAPIAATITPNTGVPAPVVSITNPVVGNLADPGTVTITATATVSSGTIASVQFLINDAPFSTATTAPFSVLWTPVYGTYSLKALATSSAGTNAVSNTVNVSVIPFVPTITRQPYLQMPAPTAVTVKWRTTESHIGRVWYGAAPGALSSFVDESVTATNHEIRISGLQPNTRYYYGVGSPTVTVSGNDADTFFYTAPLPGRAKPTRIWALGDAGQGTTAQADTRNAYYNTVGTKHTDIMLMLGDNAYTSGLDSEYQSRFFDFYNPIIRKSHVWSTIGNHETFAGTPYPYYDIFTFPIAAECGGIASGTEAYYSFDHGNIHFICLDSMVSNRAANGPMATWLTNDIASTNARWIIGFFHHPPYTRGGYDSDTMTEAVAMRANLAPILEQFGVDVVLSGHDHNYERTWFISGNYGSSATFNAATMKKDPGYGRPLTDGPYVKNVNISEANKGSVYIVAGSAGALYAAPTAHPAIAVGLNLYGTALLDIDGNRFDMSFLKADGTVGDNFTIVKPYGNVDTDGDGMPDDYENESGFAPANSADGSADNDGDGRSNRDEFASGTNPFDGTSFLSTSIQAVGGGFNFTFNTIPGYRYTVETKDSLATPDWTEMPNATNLRGTGGERTIADPTAVSARFYRVKATAE